MARRITDEQWADFHHRHYIAGRPMKESAIAAGIGYSTAKAYCIRRRDNGELINPPQPEPEPDHGIYRYSSAIEQVEHPDVRRALVDFQFFRRRYLGRDCSPWQAFTADLIVEWLEANESEYYAVINMPPGSGKTAMLQDICLWMICRHRSIRILWGSYAEKLAKKSVMQIRDILASPFPLKAPELDKSRGWAHDADGTLSVDFGNFKPKDKQIPWNMGEFTVVQHDANDNLAAKEPTVAAFGMDSAFLGWRVDINIWDDLSNTKMTRSPNRQEQQNEWWDNEGETRLDPGGVLVNCMQRLGPEDISRHCIDKPLYDLTGEATGTKKYIHIRFPAHNDNNCNGDHGVDAEPIQPQLMHDGTVHLAGGCLLDPHRLSWKRLAGKMADNNYRTVYQQEDTDPAKVLVPKEWVYGGRCPREKNVDRPGCIDKDRYFLDLPETPLDANGYRHPLLSIATVDPSPTKYWGIIWWLVDIRTGTRYLMDLESPQMSSEDFYDYSPETGDTGLLPEWQTRSADMGYPIRYWILEINAAQRWLMKQTMGQRFISRHRTSVIGHTTSGINKHDPNLGVGRVASSFKHGIIRLPMPDDDHQIRTKCLRLVDEVTKYPQSNRTDLLMSCWFLENRIDELIAGGVVTGDDGGFVEDRPSWMRPNHLRAVG